MCPTRLLFKRLKYKFEMIGKEETEKKFIFSYGIGDVTMEAKEENFLIPNVHYTPEVTLNILSYDLLEEQRYIVEVSNNKCYIHYMLGGKGKGKAQEESSTEDDGLKNVVTEHNKYLDEYFESIKPKEEVSLVKGLEELIDEIPPVVGVMEINLLSLHKIIDNLRGYLCVTLGDKWKIVAGLQGLTDDDEEAIKDCYKKFIDMVQVYYETAEKPWYERKPKNDVVESSSGIAKVKNPQGKNKDKARKEEALEEDMNMKTQFGVRLEGNMEEEAEQGSITDSNDFEVIV
nr:ARID DNA-binding domain-containing protein [Tanacetum cinerariifolium]